MTTKMTKLSPTCVWSVVSLLIAAAPMSAHAQSVLEPAMTDSVSRICRAGMSNGMRDVASLESESERNIIIALCQVYLSGYQHGIDDLSPTAHQTSDFEIKCRAILNDLAADGSNGIEARISAQYAKPTTSLLFVNYCLAHKNGMVHGLNLARDNAISLRGR